MQLNEDEKAVALRNDDGEGQREQEIEEVCLYVSYSFTYCIVIYFFLFYCS